MRFAPGERFSYNNAGFILLGLIVEQLSGMEFPRYVESHVLTRGGMSDSGYFFLDRLPERTALVLGSGQDYVGALICPDFHRLREWTERNGIHAKRLTDHPAVRDLYASELLRINPLIEVKFQRVKRAVLTDREPSLERGELTPSAKIVRQRVCESHKHLLAELFKPEPAECVIDVMPRQLQRT